MARKRFTRRRFNQWLASGLLLKTPLVASVASLTAGCSAGKYPKANIKVAAIQMTPKLADLSSNLRQAEALTVKALKQGAKWVILPEMFTTAAGFHPDMHKAIQPHDGAPFKMMQQLSRQWNAVVGGSFLASRNGQVYNSFFLVFPDGKVTMHDKDLPTYWENCYYRGGNDNGVMSTPAGAVGSALCWEFIRSQTARRMLGKVNLVVGGSCWWTLPDEADSDSPRRADNLKMLKEAAPRMAKMLGVPVIHGSHAGNFKGFFSPSLPDVEYNSSYLGEAMIVDAQGKVLASRSKKEGAGVVMATIDLPEKANPVETIPKNFWIPKEMPEDWKSSFKRWQGTGADYYKLITQHYLKTGEIREYTPEYMRD